jgi:hypothetical protein
MLFKTHNEKEINVNGTSLQGYVSTTYEKLVETFGEPTNSDGYKSDAEWEIEFIEVSDDEVIVKRTAATIYNWKDGKNYNGCNGMDVEDITDWHIGGNNKDVVKFVKEILN